MFTPSPASDCPPSQTTTAPVMNLAASLDRNSARSAISSFVAKRRSGMLRASCFFISGVGARRFIPSVSSTAPGAIELTRTPSGPHSIARHFVSMSTPAFAAQTCACIGIGVNACMAVVDIDLLGTFNTCRAVFEHLRRPGASIINISAMQAFTPMPMQAHVCAAKAGVDMLTKCLAIEWGPDGVRVNSIAPGAVDDTEGMKRLAPTPEIKKQLARSIPLRRFATKDEIADLALFLSSDAARFITGAVVVCDGGQSLAGLGVNMMAAMQPRA